MSLCRPGNPERALPRNYLGGPARQAGLCISHRELASEGTSFCPASAEQHRRADGRGQVSLKELLPSAECLCWDPAWQPTATTSSEPGCYCVNDCPTCEW